MLQKLTKFKIRLQLLIGFGILSLIGFCSFYYSLTLISEGKEYSDSIFHSSLMPLSHLESLSERINKLHDIKYRLKEDKSYKIETNKDEIIFYISDFIRAVEFIRKDNNNFSYKLKSEFLEIKKKIMNRSVSESDIKVFFVILNSSSIHKHIHIYSEYLKSIGLAGKLKSQVLYDKSIKTSIAFAIVLLLTSLFVFLMIFNGIISKLSLIENHCNKINAGDTSSRLPEKNGNSELGSLFKSYNTMLDSLVTSHKKLDSIFKSIRAYIIITDKHGNILSVNDFFYEHTGLTKESMEEKNIETYLGKNVFEECLKGVSDLQVKLSINDDVVRAIRLNCFKIESPASHDESFLYIATDVTKKVETIRKLKEQEAAIIQSSKLASLGEMAGGVAHEINNPLAVITMSVMTTKKMLKKEDFDLTKVNQMLNNINAMAERISKITHGMGIASRSSIDDNFDIFKVNDILEDITSLCEAKFKSSGINFEVKVEKNIKDQNIYCLRVPISQIFINLLNNAYDAVKEAQTIEPKIIFKISQKDSNFIFEILDNGPGIPEEVAKNIFKPFFTTKGIGKGTGIGLGISKSIAQKHRGNFYLDSESALTRFVFEVSSEIPNDF